MPPGIPAVSQNLTRVHSPCLRDLLRCFDRYPHCTGEEIKAQKGKVTCPRPFSCTSAFQRLHEVSLEEETNLIFERPGGIILIIQMGLSSGWEQEAAKASSESQGGFKLWRGR